MPLVPAKVLDIERQQIRNSVRRSLPVASPLHRAGSCSAMRRLPPPAEGGRAGSRTGNRRKYSIVGGSIRRWIAFSSSAVYRHKHAGSGYLDPILIDSYRTILDDHLAERADCRDNVTLTASVSAIAPTSAGSPSAKVEVKDQTDANLLLSTASFQIRVSYRPFSANPRLLLPLARIRSRLPPLT